VSAPDHPVGAYRPGLPSDVDICAHDTRGGLWVYSHDDCIRFLTLSPPSGADPQGFAINSEGYTLHIPDLPGGGQGLWRPVSPDGWPMPWPDAEPATLTLQEELDLLVRSWHPRNRFDRSARELVEHVVRHPPFRFGTASRWVAVRLAFGLGSTSATALCRFFGENPDDEVGEGMSDDDGRCHLCGSDVDWGEE
jgi:hypothetical protein